jgi:hypothetical protein
VRLPAQIPDHVLRQGSGEGPGQRSPQGRLTLRGRRFLITA